MRLLGNILWLVLGGLAIAIGWALVGLLLCITIIGIPLGVQAFKMAELTLTPFGKTVVYDRSFDSTLMNIFWVVLVGWWMALGYVLAGALAVRRADSLVALNGWYGVRTLAALALRGRSRRGGRE